MDNYYFNKVYSPTNMLHCTSEGVNNFLAWLDRFGVNIVGNVILLTERKSAQCDHRCYTVFGYPSDLATSDPSV